MKILRLIIGVVSLFFLFNTLGFTKDILRKDDYKIIPQAASSSDKFLTPQESIQEEEPTEDTLSEPVSSPSTLVNLDEPVSNPANPREPISEPLDQAGPVGPGEAVIEIPAGAIDFLNSLGLNAEDTGDLNADGVVNMTDMLLFAEALNKVMNNVGKTGEGIEGDLNGDGCVNMQDVLMLVTYKAVIDKNMGKVVGPSQRVIEYLQSQGLTVHCNGDLNDDGVVNMTDMLLFGEALQAVLDHVGKTGPEYAQYDLTGDGAVTMADVLRLLTYKAVIDKNMGTQPQWWDGMTVDQINATLLDLIGEGKLDEATQKYSELAGADLDLAAQVMQGMKTATAAYIVNQLDVGLAADVLEKVDAKKVAEILTAHDTMEILIYPIPPIISADKAGQILAAMDKGKAADVLEVMKPKGAVTIIKAILTDKGAATVAGIMKVMDAKKAAAIMAVSGSKGLTVKQCADILREMGGLRDKTARKIFISLLRQNFVRAIAVLRELIRRRITG